MEVRLRPSSFFQSKRVHSTRRGLGEAAYPNFVVATVAIFYRLLRECWMALSDVPWLLRTACHDLLVRAGRSRSENIPRRHSLKISHQKRNRHNKTAA